ncbi:MAG: DUF1801 domain-containing protein [Actinomycetes bacterium]
MPFADIDDYLATVPEPHRSTLLVLRKRIHTALPGAVECITYNLPTFKRDGHSIAGFGAFTRHCSYFPMSGAVLDMLGDEIEGFTTSRGTLRFPPDKPLSQVLVRKLVRTRLANVAERGY